MIPKIPPKDQAINRTLCILKNKNVLLGFTWFVSLKKKNKIATKLTGITKINLLKNSEPINTRPVKYANKTSLKK